MKTSYQSNFIQSLRLVGYCKQLAQVLLTCEQECSDFFIGYFGTNKMVMDDLLDYREWRLSDFDMSFESFKEKCKDKADKHTFERTFLQHIGQAEIDFINSKIVKEEVTLKDIFEGFLKNSNESILKNVM